MGISELIFNVGLLFIMMVPGIILKKCKFVSADFGKGISNLVLYIAQPSLIVYAYMACESSFSDIWQNCLVTLVLSIIAHVIFSSVALLLFRKQPESKRKMLRLVTIFANAAFMGIPLIQAMLGAEAAIYASIYNITFNFFLWTLGVHLCTVRDGEDLDGDGEHTSRDRFISAHRNMKKETSLLRVLLHPVTIASAVGVTLLVSGVNIPVLDGAGLGIIPEVFAMLKGLVAPLSMIVIGLRLADIDMSGTLSDRGMYLFLVLRHAVLPLAVVTVIWAAIAVGIPIGRTAALVTIILAATPAASSSTMFAEKYDCDAGYTSRLVIISTVISIATMPAVLAVANLLLFPA